MLERVDLSYDIRGGVVAPATPALEERSLEAQNWRRRAALQIE